MKNNTSNLNTKSSVKEGIQIAKLKKANESLGKTVVRLESENTQFQSEISQLRKDLGSAQRSKGVIDRKFNGAKKTIEEQAQEINRLNVLLSETASDRDNYKSSYESITRRQANFVVQAQAAEDYAKLHFEYAKLAEKVANQDQEIAELKYKNGELMARNCRLACTPVIVDVTEYVDRIEGLEMLVNNLRHSLEHYEAHVDEYGNLVEKPTIWDMDILLADMQNPNKQKNDDLRIRLVHSQYGYYVDARIFKDGEPTRRGLCLAPDKMVEFTGVLEYALEKAMEVIDNE
jgi:chromosome segregation ATPase